MWYYLSRTLNKVCCKYENKVPGQTKVRCWIYHVHYILWEYSVKPNERDVLYLSCAPN